jgi:hypothetical protein
MSQANEQKIKEGYVMIARQILHSEIMDFPLAWRFLWVWMLLRANHTDVKRRGQVFYRGELLTSYEEMIEVCAYMIGWRKVEGINKNGVESFVKRLKKDGMITTRKTTKGLFIRIVNYDYFQTPSNYEAYIETDKKTTTKPQTSDTINKNDENEKNGKNINTGRSPENENTKEDIDQLRKGLAKKFSM